MIVASYHLRNWHSIYEITVKWLNLLVFSCPFFGQANVDALYLTSRSEIMLERTTVAHKGVPFVWNARFITVFGETHLWTLNWTRWIQSASQYSVSETILSTSRFPGSFSSLTHPCKCENVSCYVTEESHSPFLSLSEYIWLYHPSRLRHQVPMTSVHTCHTTLRRITKYFEFTSDLQYVT
jgi:hypothetical protein